ncbi:L-type lectin-domain containing receptor kinase IV.1-like [Pyrus ussuriensis x Pyrus communis]|uniref:non-specific serine/threonine protein kinase n=1 Tax=Pyrus ussuriensis x Pyrus communis TaxID=2448454 RepID=A0A5N5H2F7_9ROSA|nr:L-type lectin-domain containing receptor kinase IV.1-like [Pyrus ussuriensis x Pyrus communis]
MFMLFKFVILILTSVAAAEDFNFTYHGFRSANLSLEGVAEVTSDGILRVTNDTVQSIGHAFYPNPVTFKNSSDGPVLSFSSTFTFAMRYKVRQGHGIVFVIAPTTGLPGASPVGFFGLFNRTNDGSPTNHVFAVELDTFENPEFNDINDNHVGIDINGVVSVVSAPAGYYAGERLITSGQPVQVWVDYDGTKKQINVSLALVSNGKPYNPLLSLIRDLSPILHRTMYVGFSASTGNLTAINYVLGWSFTMNGHAEELGLSQLPKMPRLGPKKIPKLLTIGLPVILVSSALLAFVFWVYYAIRRKKKFADLLEDWELEYGPQRFKYRELYIATKGFREKELLGKGGFGKVYRGILPTSGTVIAVKRVSHESRQGMKEFVAEIVSNGRLRHRNLVPLLGYCRRKGELLLVYEYMPNGSLDKYLFDRPAVTLDWSQRFRVIRGVALGLLYLHEEWDQVVVHRDVKASNILLDGEWNGRLGDFGLARLYDHGADPQTTHIAGTFGYLAPEYTRSCRATTSSDVFAFGVCLLEVACGRRPIENHGSENVILVDWVFSCWKGRNILEAKDPKLGNDFVAEEVELVLKLGLFCCQSEPSMRPRMRQVVQHLEDNVPLPAEFSLLGLSSRGLGFSQNEGFDEYTMAPGSSVSSYVPDSSFLSRGR